MDNVSLAIIINLTLAILVLGVGGAYSLKKLSKERNVYKDALHKTKKRLREALYNANKPDLAETDASPAFDNMVSDLQNELAERERIIEALNAAQADIDDAIESISSDDELTSEQAKEKIESLIALNQNSTDLIAELRDQVALGHQRIKKLMTEHKINAEFMGKKNDQKTSELNRKLVNTLSELTSKADMTGRSLKDSKLKLRISKNIEQQLLAKITTLEGKVGQTSGEKQVDELEQEIYNLKQELERTTREKELIEKHLLSMDESIDDVKNVEDQLTRAQLEIETLEKYVVIFDDQLEEQSDDTRASDPDAAELGLISNPSSESEDTLEDTRTLPQARAKKDASSGGYNIFPYVEEFYTKFLNTSVTETDISVSQNDLTHWIHIGIGDGATLAVGFSKGMANYIANELFDSEGDSSDTEIKDAMGEFANVVAGGLANDFFEGGSLAIPEHITAEDNQQIFAFTAVEKETGAVKQGNSVYIALVRSR